MAFEIEFAQLAARGMIVPGGEYILPSNDILASDAIAMDAVPTLSTSPNAGIPAFMTTYVDPDLIDVVFTPMRGAEIAGEMKKGDFVTLEATFPMIEATGEVASYGDWDNAGEFDINANWPNRESYHYQGFARWGERQVETFAAARIQYVAGLRSAAVKKLNKFQNQTYFFGVEGLKNYGYLNDPSLPASISPGAKAAGGVEWENATSLERVADVVKLVQQLIAQTGGIVDTTSRLKLVLSPNMYGLLFMPNEFGLSVEDQLKKQFQNLEVLNAPEMGDLPSQSVQTMMLLAEELDGQQVATAAFTEKLRTHTVIPEASAWKQKLSQGTWGAIIYMPVGIATMTGI